MDDTHVLLKSLLTALQDDDGVPTRRGGRATRIAETNMRRRPSAVYILTSLLPILTSVLNGRTGENTEERYQLTY